MSTVPPLLAIVLFGAGMGILIALTSALQRTRRLYHAAEGMWAEISALLEERSARLANLEEQVGSHPALSRPLVELTDSLARRIAAESPSERLLAEQELSRTIAVLAATAEVAAVASSAAGSGRFAMVMAEIQEQELALTILRERYNESAFAWNRYRHGFPGRLLADALCFPAFPLFQPLG